MTIDYDQISHGVRALVRQLNEWGFETTDSGGGSNYVAAMECAVDFPMVTIRVSRPSQLITQAHAVWHMLERAGVPMGKPDAAGNARTVEATYNPADTEALLLVMHVTSSDLDG